MMMMVLMMMLLMMMVMMVMMLIGLVGNWKAGWIWVLCASERYVLWIGLVVAEG